MPSNTRGQTIGTDQAVQQLFLDPLEQLYTINSEGALCRYDAAIDSVFIFDDNLLGEISSIDASNPMGPLILFQEHQIILQLDRTLSEQSRIDLRSNGQLQQAGTFIRNFDNQFWVYDEWDYRIKRFNPTGELQQQTDDLRLQLGLTTPPASLQVVGNRLIAHFPDEGLAIFSILGQFINLQSLPSADHYQWTSKGLLGWGETSAWLWSGNEAEEIDLPEAAYQADQLLFWQDGLLARKGDKMLFLK